MCLGLALATCPEVALRNGMEAVELARRAAQLSHGREPAVLDALAAAYAENGQFSEAVAAAQRALDLASAHGNTVLADAIRARIKLYRSATPFHQTPPVSSGNAPTR